MPGGASDTHLGDGMLHVRLVVRVVDHSVFLGVFENFLHCGAHLLTPRSAGMRAGNVCAAVRAHVGMLRLVLKACKEVRLVRFPGDW